MILFDSVLKKVKNYYQQVFLEEYIITAKYYPEIPSAESDE